MVCSSTWGYRRNNGRAIAPTTNCVISGFSALFALNGIYALPIIRAAFIWVSPSSMSHAGRIVLTQIVVGALCVIVFLAIDIVQARSAMFALATTVIPSSYYAWVLQRTHNATRLLLHGVIRMLATLTFMAMCIVVFTVEPMGYFVTLVIVQLGYFTPRPRAQA
jgi:hypothetical protein